MKRPLLHCPSCGWDGTTLGAHGHAFKYLEEVTSMRTVVGVTKRSVRVACDERITGDGPDSSPRLMCANCLEEFPIPAGMKIAFS
jgi:hypothetical protein